MNEKKFSLTKNETDRLADLLQLARFQEGILGCITETYTSFIKGILKRFSIDEKFLPNAIIELGTGEMIIRDEPIKPKVKKV